MSDLGLEATAQAEADVADAHRNARTVRQVKRWLADHGVECRPGVKITAALDELLELQRKEPEIDAGWPRGADIEHIARGGIPGLAPAREILRVGRASGKTLSTLAQVTGVDLRDGFTSDPALDDPELDELHAEQARAAERAHVEWRSMIEDALRSGEPSVRLTQTLDFGGIGKVTRTALLVRVGNDHYLTDESTRIGP
jgi:hypothetical protein